MTEAVHVALRSPGIRRGIAALAAALLAAGLAGALIAPVKSAAAAIPASQPLVVLLGDQVVRVRPSRHARRVEAIAARRPLTGARTILPVLRFAARRPWVRVQLPGRPNGRTGWIHTSQTKRTSTAWQITLKLSARRVTVYRGGRVKRVFRAVVGKSSTPTPRGRFFVEEAVALKSSDSGGPFALATSARSRVYQEFDGGPGQIALHGTNNLSGALGSASSHGCIRLGTRAITWMARRISAGAPLTISR